MALDKAGFIAGLEGDLTTIFENLTGQTAMQKATAIATAIANNADTFVKTGLVTVSTQVGPADAGLQVTTGLGAPTGAPVIPPAPLTGTGSIA
uniref:Uncharacterized protein n=1 Tax=viral metagenome TaxID=1070528 RepID=A0A6M3J8H7_9ZZZZ